MLLAGGLFIALGHRLENPLSILVGVGALSFGLHGELAFTFAASRVALVLATFLLFVVSVLGRRRANDVWELGTQGAILAHGVLGLSWFFMALTVGPVTIEPLILALFGWALLSQGLRERNENDAGVGLGFLIAYAPIHLWAAGFITSVPVFLMIMLASLLVARALAPPLLSKPLQRLFRFWRATAVLAAIVFIGMETLALAAIVVLVGALAGKVPYRSLLLVLGHALVWLEGASLSFFPLALIEASATAFPLAAALALGWILLVELTSGTNALAPWRMAIEAFVMFGFFIGAIPIGIFTVWNYGVLIAVALAFAARHALASYRQESTGHAWSMQVWAGLAVLAGYYAGWVSFGNGRAPYILLAAGIIQYGLAALCERNRKAEPLVASALGTGQALALVSGVVALGRLQTIPLFLVSLFYLILASCETNRVTPSVFSASFLGVGLVAIAHGHGVGMEFYSLAPGFTLVALALLLADEMGPRWSRHVFTAGAAFIYATPVLALYDDITWAWQAVLLLLTLGFGSASFWLKSRPLLTVSTAALVIDLACFIIKIRETEPLLLWVGGLMLGVGLMTLAAYLEYRREGLAQQIRVFGQELAGWY